MLRKRASTFDGRMRLITHHACSFISQLHEQQNRQKKVFKNFLFRMYLIESFFTCLKDCFNKVILIQRGFRIHAKSFITR